MQANAQKASEQAKGHWNKVQSDWDQHIQRIRADLDERKAERDAKHAEREAEDAEADALDATDFAAAAIEEAEYRRPGRSAGQAERGRASGLFSLTRQIY